MVPIIYYVFDVLILAGRNVMSEPLSTRRALLRSEILPKLGEPIGHCPELNASLADVIQSVRAASLEAWWRSAWTALMGQAAGPVHGARCESIMGKNSSLAGIG